MHVVINSCRLKGDQKFLGSGLGQKWVWPVWWQDSKIDRIWRMNRWNDWYCAYWYSFLKNKSRSKMFWVDMVKMGVASLIIGTLKLTVSQKWTDRINWFFACWYKFRKSKCRFNDFWVGVVKNGHGLLVHETLKCATS